MKKKIVYFFAFVFVIALCMSFVACKSGGNDPAKTKKLESGSVVAEGTFDEGVALSASKLTVTDQNYVDALGKVADKNYDEDNVAVYDISLVKNSAKVQPSGKVKITMSAPFVSEIGYVTYHIKGETVEELATTYADGKISFETDGFSYFVIAGKADESTPVYTLVDKNGKADENGGYVLFGSYPQSVVKDDAVKSALAQKAGELPKDGNNGNWTSYKYHYGKKNTEGEYETANETDFMWYIDVKLDGETYRGVYFTYYRPNAAVGDLQDDSASYIFGYQKSNGYTIGNLYWFKYEPLLWQIIRTQEGKAQLICMSAIDSQAYTLVIKKSENRFTDEKDTHYVYYNDTPGVPQNTLATDYQYSAIRAWLNDSFYQNAFNSKQKKLISETLLDNESGDVGANTSDKVFVPSIAEIKDLKDLYRKASDYAKSQNVATDYSRTSCDFWYTRDAFYVLKFQDKKDMISYDRDRYKNVCGVNGGYLYAPTGSTGFSGAGAANSGVVPSLWLTL